MLQPVQVMQQLGFGGCVGAHRQRKLALRFGQPSGALNQFATQGAQLLEAPQRHPPFRRTSLLLGRTHLHLPVQVVGQHGRDEIDLIARPISSGHIVHLCLRLQLGKEPFLRTSSIVVGQYFFGRELLVGDNYLEVIAVLIGNEQVQLHGFLMLLAASLADTDETVATIPAFRLPLRFTA